MHKHTPTQLKRLLSALVLAPLLAMLLGGWGFIGGAKKQPKPPVIVKPVTLRDIPLGLYDFEVRYRKGEPNWQTADGELIYEEPTASYSVALDPDSRRVVRVCEVGDQFEVLGIRVGDSLGKVIETLGVPSAELLNRAATDGLIIYSRQQVSFMFRNRRVHEVCVLNEQEQQRLANRR